MILLDPAIYLGRLIGTPNAPARRAPGQPRLSCAVLGVSIVNHGETNMRTTWNGNWRQLLAVASIGVACWGFVSGVSSGQSSSTTSQSSSDSSRDDSQSETTGTQNRQSTSGQSSSQNSSGQSRSGQTNRSTDNSSSSSSNRQ